MHAIYVAADNQAATFSSTTAVVLAAGIGAGGVFLSSIVSSGIALWTTRRATSYEQLLDDFRQIVREELGHADLDPPVRRRR